MQWIDIPGNSTLPNAINMLNENMRNLEITSEDLAESAITSEKIAEDAVDADAIAYQAVETQHIGEAQIQTAHIQDAAITNALIEDASIDTAKIQDAAITTAKIGLAAIDSANIKDAAIGTAHIQDAAITNAKIDRLGADKLTVNTADIADAAITNGKIGLAAIDAANIKDAAIGAAHIQDAAITNAKIARLGADKLTVNTADIADAAITNAKIGLAAIDAANIKDAVIGTAHIQDAAITNAKITRLGADKLTVNTADIADAAITNAKIGEAAIDSANIADAAIISAKISLAAINTAHIAHGAIETAQIATGAITTALINDGAIKTAQIADGSITDAKIVALTAERITSGTIDTTCVTVLGPNGNLKISKDRLQVFDNQAVPLERVSLGDVNDDGTLFGLRVRGGDGTTVLFNESGVTPEGITDGSITNDKISTDADIDGGKLLDNSIPGGKLVIDAITAREIAGEAITANEIASNAITTAKIASSAVTANEIAAGTITADKLTCGAGSVAPGNIAAGKLASRTGAEASNTPTDGSYLAGSLIYEFGLRGDNLAEPESACFTIDLGEVFRIAESRLYFYSGNDGDGDTTRTYWYKIKYSADGETWHYAAGMPGDSGWAVSAPALKGTPACNPTVDHFPVPISARHVRVVGNGNTVDANNGIYEVELYSTGATIIDGGQIRTGSITADKLAIGTITADVIVAKSIRADQIATGTITADEIASGAITADKLTCGSGGTAPGNLALGKDVTGTGGNPTIPTDGLYLAGSPVYTFGTRGENLQSTESASLTIDLGNVYRIAECRVYFYSGSETDLGRTRFYWYKIKYSTDGETWYYAAGMRDDSGWQASAPAVNGTPTCNPTVNLFAVPISARYVKLIGNGNSIDDTNAVYEMELYSTGAMIIDGGQIKTNSISADKITAGTLNADIIFTGEFRGVHGTFTKLTAGEVDPDSLRQRLEMGATDDNKEPYINFFDSGNNMTLSIEKDRLSFHNSTDFKPHTIGTRTGLGLFAL